MISSLHGTLTIKTPTEILVNVHGVGYSVHISLSTFSQLPETGSEVELLTHLHIREDAHVLYGFADAIERDLFRLLITINGIGPKLAQTILSGMQPHEVLKAISQSALATLTSIPGIGRKTAERLIVELRDKTSKMTGGEHSKTNAHSAQSEAVSALISLGYSKEKAERSVSIASQGGGIETVEDIIKSALKIG